MVLVVIKLFYICETKQKKYAMNFLHVPEIAEKIEVLKQQQLLEAEGNFQNGDLWNDLESKIVNLVKYGQEADPVEFYNEAGYADGYRLESGETVYYSGMSIYDYAD